MAVLKNIPTACNRATADLLIAKDWTNLVNQSMPKLQDLTVL
jgi:methylglyoxal synthase